MTGGGIRGGEILNCYVERAFQTEIQTGFRIHPDLFTFADRFNTDARARAGSSADDCAFTPAGDTANDGPDGCANSGSFGGLCTLRTARIGVGAGFQLVTGFTSVFCRRQWSESR